MDAYEPRLNAIEPKRVSFGCQTIHLYQPNKLASGQLGYSVGPNGEDLTGDTDGDWRRAWVVIGYNEACGDPLFIDTTEENFPVYTAMIGQGRWDRKPVAVSLETFGRFLSIIAAVSQGRDCPVALEEHPLSYSEKGRVLASIRDNNVNLNMDFWDAFLSG